MQSDAFKLLLCSTFCCGYQAAGLRTIYARAQVANGAFESQESCNASTPTRKRSLWCEQNLDEHITFERIQEGQGLCLDGHCYDASSLRKWLSQSEKLPHNRKPFIVSALDTIILGDPRVLTASATVLSVAFGAGDMIATAAGRIVELWSTRTGQAIQHFVGHQGTVMSACFSPDGGRLLTTSLDGTARTWDVDTGEELLRLQATIAAAVFSPNLRLVLIGGLEGEALFLDAVTGKEQYRLSFSSSEWGDFDVAAFNPQIDGEVVFAFGDGSVTFVDIHTGVEIVSILAHDCRINSVAFSPDGRRLLTAANDGLAKIWDTATGMLLRTLSGHMSSINRVDFSPDGRRLLTGSSDFTARLWETDTGTELRRLGGSDGRRYFCQSVAFARDGRQVAVAFAQETRIYAIDF